MNRRQKKKMITSRKWRRLVSANFLVDEESGKPIKKRDMMRLGVSPKRIERIEQESPMVDPNAL